MAAFTRQQQHFDCLGVQLTRSPANCDPGKFAILQNVRSYIQGELTGRVGLALKSGVSGNPVHSIIQVQDPTPFAGTNPQRFIGGGANLYAGPVNGPFPQIDTGYSGNPLSFATAVPPQSPQPWLYVTDSSRMRKVNSNGNVFPIGVAAPTIEPVGTLGRLGYVLIGRFFGAVPWGNAGPQASAFGFSAAGRINTTISAIIYDVGNTGNCSIAPVSMAGFDDGILVSVNASEDVIVEEVTVAIATTSIAAIIYDAGNSGPCTIQPAASLGTGRTELPINQTTTILTKDQVIPVSFAGAPNPVQTGAPVVRQIDFPTNALVTIGGAVETIRILSVATGKDGVQSFRCVTANTHNPGDSLTGVPAFRCNTLATFAPGQTVKEGAVQNVLTPVITSGQTTGLATGGIQGTPATGFAPVNLSLINGRATLPDDDFHCSINVNNLAEVTTVRIYLDVDQATNDFTQNYYFFEWSANDIIAAIQGQNANNVSSLQDVRVETITNAELNNLPSFINRQALLAAIAARDNATVEVTDTPGGPTSALAVPSQLQLGNNQWLELRCKVRDLIRVGTDPSRSLANVAAAEIIVAIDGPSPITIMYDSLWLSGGFGPDVGSIGAPYFWRYRYRSSATGAVSNPSPPSLGGMLPHRQTVSLLPLASTDPQCDLIDWFRLGGALTTWTYVGTNANGTLFTDTIPDQAAGGDALSFEQFQPWPTQDLARVGTCNVAGTAIRWVSGPQFNVLWAPGSAILINGVTCTIFKVASPTLLFTNENAGSGNGVIFTLTGPTLQSQTFATWWGGGIGGATYYFSCGDTVSPGYVVWTNGNDSESASDANRAFVTAPSEPLQNGFMYDGISFVASTEQIYQLRPTGSGESATAFTPEIQPAGKGFWTRWAFCVAPEGCYFLAKDGIYLTQGGAAAISITDADLYPLFPHDGSLGVAVNGYAPVDMTQTTRLRLTWVEGWLYFDYLDTNGASRTLAYWTVTKSWWPDVYTPGITTRCATQGQGTNVELLGGTDGSLYTMNGVATDNGAAIACHFQMTQSQGDERREKLYRDNMVDADLGGGTATATLGVTNNSVTLPPQVLGPSAGRAENFINAAAFIGTYGLNITLDMTWNPVAVGQPVFFVWDFAYQMTPELATSWLSGPTTHGLSGFQQVYLALIAYRSFGPVQYTLIIDGVGNTYSLPSTAGQYQKFPFPLLALKGLTFQHSMQGALGFQVFDADCEFWTQQWGAGGGYQKLRPF